VVQKGAAHHLFKGHSSHVTNVRWMFDDSYAISAGGHDRCVMQWKKV
jgi:hypothetical protein